LEKSNQTDSGTSLTKTQLISGKLPQVVVWELGRVNVHVAISMNTFYDFPLYLVFRFLLETEMREGEREGKRDWGRHKQ